MRSIGQSVGFKNIIADGLDCWTAENPDTDLPKSYYDDSTNKKNIYRDTAGSDITSVDNRSSRFYEKGDYLALRELTLSWKLSILQDIAALLPKPHWFIRELILGVIPLRARYW